MSVRDPSGVESSLMRSAVRAGLGAGAPGAPGAPGPPRGSGVSPVGRRLSVAMATTMMLFESLGLTKTMGSPAPRLGLPRRRYSSDLNSSDRGGVADWDRTMVVDSAVRPYTTAVQERLWGMVIRTSKVVQMPD